MHFSCLCRKKLRKCISKAFKCIQFVEREFEHQKRKFDICFLNLREREGKKARKQMKEGMHFYRFLSTFVLLSSKDIDKERKLFCMCRVSQQVPSDKKSQFCTKLELAICQKIRQKILQIKWLDRMSRFFSNFHSFLFSGARKRPQRRLHARHS